MIRNTMEWLDMESGNTRIERPFWTDIRLV